MKPLSQGISNELMDALRCAGHEHSYAADEMIFAEGDTAEFLPIVVSGSAKMVAMPAIGKEVIIGIFGPGQMFAVPPVFDGGRYPASAFALDELVLLEIPRSQFLIFLRQMPDLSFAVIAWMCEMLRDKTDTIRNFATASPEKRIVNILLRLAGGESVALPYKVHLRRQDIAEMASLTAETTIRAIRRLADQGVVDIQRGKIIIKDLQPLQAFIRD